MLNIAKKTVSMLARFFIVTGAIFFMSLAASNRAYAHVEFDNPNKVCTDTANLPLVQDAIATMTQKFPVSLGQGCAWKFYDPPGIIEPAKWYFANYTSNGQFKQGSALFKAVLDLKYACERSGGKWGAVVFPNGTGGGHDYVACQYYPKR
ncbi:MAG TPA: hypothetical protein VK596_11160 [Edaphobacter sp.]|nr:hypothetical protein [Edaphobacter sp.]